MVICSNGMRDLDRALAKEIGEKMRRTRLAVFGSKMSQGGFARLIPSASQSDISRWESGERTPSIVQFVRYAQACGVAPEEMLSGVVRARVHQLQLSLEGVAAPAATVVRRLVDMLRERQSRPTSTSAQGKAS